MFAVKAKIYGVFYNQSSSIAFDEIFSYWSAPKSSLFSDFHWSPHGSLVSIGQPFVTASVVHLPKRTETSLITESDRSGSNHRIGPGCAGRACISLLLCFSKPSVLALIRKLTILLSSRVNSIINPVLSLLMKYLVIGQRQKAPYSRIFIGHRTVVWFPLVSLS